MPTGRINAPVRWIGMAAVLVLLLCMAAGCSQPRTVQIESMTDPEMTLPAAEQALVHIAVVRVKDDVDDPDPRYVSRDRLTLPERNLLAHVEYGARNAGFPVVSRSEAEFILFCSSQTVTGERQTYRRMPVYETRHGSIHTRRGWRTFHGTTTSEVVVPVMRPFAHRIITVTVHRALTDDDWPKPDDESAVWMGRLFGDVADMEDIIAPLTAELLGAWGRTERRSIRLRDLVERE